MMTAIPATDRLCLAIPIASASSQTGFNTRSAPQRDEAHLVYSIPLLMQFSDVIRTYSALVPASCQSHLQQSCQER